MVRAVSTVVQQTWRPYPPRADGQALKPWWDYAYGGPGMARAVRSYEEQSAYTGWRKVMFWQRGELSKIKRRTHKRERREGIADIRGQQ